MYLHSTFDATSLGLDNPLYSSKITFSNPASKNGTSDPPTLLAVTVLIDAFEDVVEPGLKLATDGTTAPNAMFRKHEH